MISWLTIKKSLTKIDTAWPQFPSPGKKKTSFHFENDIIEDNQMASSMVRFIKYFNGFCVGASTNNSNSNRFLRHFISQYDEFYSNFPR